jgi:hypothetical protein
MIRFDSMRAICVSSLLVTGFAGNALAQQWEVGVLGGGSFYLNNSVTGPRGSGDLGFKPGLTAGGWLGHSTNGHFGGEVRYLYQRNDLRVAGGGSEYTFGGESHIVTYDFLYHTNSREDRVRPYVVGGAGFKAYRGTGTERAFQPLTNIGILTKTQEWKPVVNFGAGVKWNFSSRLTLRAEFRDYVSPFPKAVLLPGPGGKVSGWVHDLTPLIGLSYTFN